MSYNSRKSTNENLTQLQINRLSPYTPDPKKWFDHYMAEASGESSDTTDSKKWFDHYMAEASGQKYPDFNKPSYHSKARPIVISEVESANDQAESELREEKKNINSKSTTRGVKRKAASQGGGRSKKKAATPKDIFST